MSFTNGLFHRVLVATDFSDASTVAFRQAVWLGRRCGSSLVLAHCLEHLRRAENSLAFKEKIDALSAEGDSFQREIRKDSDQKLRAMIVEANAPELSIDAETLTGEPFLELIHSVQQERYDLLISGSRGLSPWKEFLVGSTARKLIRKCPCDVWVVRKEATVPPRVILAACDFSDVSRKAVCRAARISEKSGAVLHVLHVIDSGDIPDDLLSRLPEHGSIRSAINEEAASRLQEFLSELPCDTKRVHSHLAYGSPWQEIARFVTRHGTDLICMGTTGRSGIAGMLLGSTADRILDTCQCSILTTKPDSFVSPVTPATWPMHP